MMMLFNPESNPCFSVLALVLITLGGLWVQRRTK
jgi:hypothetical protein